MQLPLKVAVRVRPLLPHEGQESRSSVQEKENGFFAPKVVIPTSLPLLPIDYTSATTLEIAKKYSFSFDHVFNPSSSQVQIFGTLVQPLLTRYLEGYNTSILAYGQTGTGKTFTMGTNTELSDGNETGILTRSIQYIFSQLHKSESPFTVRVSFLEIYNEDIVDLLEVNEKGVISVREDSDGQIVIHPLKKAQVYSAQQCVELLQQGLLTRSTASTQMNAFSSRSHAIYTIFLERTIDQSVVFSKCHFVDLAGSERLKKTLSTGDRQKESISINQGLLALGNCIRALTEEKSPLLLSHIPFRDSKLTRLLQDSLGGNSMSVLIACVSPMDRDTSETVNTLRYASKARFIRNECVVNHGNFREERRKPAVKLAASELVTSDDRQILLENEQLLEENRLLKLKLSLSENAEKLHLGSEFPRHLDSIGIDEMSEDQLRSLVLDLLVKSGDSKKEVLTLRNRVNQLEEEMSKYDVYVNLCDQYENWLEEKETQLIRVREERDFWREKENERIAKEAERDEEKEQAHRQAIENQQLNQRLERELKQLREMADQTLTENGILSKEQNRLLLELKLREKELLALKYDKENNQPLKMNAPISLNELPQSPSQLLASKINGMFVKTPLKENQNPAMSSLIDKSKEMQSRFEKLLMRTKREEHS